MKAFILLAILMMTGCGSQTESKDDDAKDLPAKGKAAEGQYGSFMVEGKWALPDCNDSMQSALAYVKEIEGFMTCDGTEWAEIALEGLDPDYHRYNQDWYFVSREALPASETKRCPANHKIVTGDEVGKVFQAALSDQPFWSIGRSRFFYYEPAVDSVLVVYRALYDDTFDGASQNAPVYTICKKNKGA